MLQKLLRIGTLISTYGFVLSVMLQVFARFLLPSAPSWTEELSRFCFIYAVAFSGGLAVESKEYIHLDWLYQKLSVSTRRIIDNVIAILTILFFGLIAFYALSFTSLGLTEQSPGLKYNMAFAFFSMFLLSVFICIYTYRAFVERTKIDSP